MIPENERRQPKAKASNTPLPSCITSLLTLKTCMTKDEYAFLSDKWQGKDGKAYQAVGESCYEMGWIDDLGLLTPKGDENMVLYMQQQGILPEGETPVTYIDDDYDDGLEEVD